MRRAEEYSAIIKLENTECGGDVPSVLERLASFPTALPVSLQLSLLRIAFAMLSLEVLCPWSFPVFRRASQSSAEFPSLLRSSPVFAGVPPCPPEFLLVVRNMVFFKLFLCYFSRLSMLFYPPRSFLSVSLFQEKTKTRAIDLMT